MPINRTFYAPKWGNGRIVTWEPTRDDAMNFAESNGLKYYSIQQAEPSGYAVYALKK